MPRRSLRLSHGDDAFRATNRLPVDLQSRTHARALGDASHSSHHQIRSCYSNVALLCGRTRMWMPLYHDLEDARETVWCSTMRWPN